MNILVYDNSVFVRTMIRQNLSRLSETLNVVLTASMPSVMETLNGNIFDLVIIDMDNLNSSFNQFIKIAKGTNPDIIIILLSSFPNEKIFQVFKSKGVDYCLDKTTEFEYLLNKIDSMLTNEYQIKKVVE